MPGEKARENSLKVSEIIAAHDWHLIDAIYRAAMGANDLRRLRSQINQLTAGLEILSQRRTGRLGIECPAVDEVGGIKPVAIRLPQADRIR
jgi:hypothetical protein